MFEPGFAQMVGDSEAWLEIKGDSLKLWEMMDGSRQSLGVICRGNGVVEICARIRALWWKCLAQIWERRFRNIRVTFWEAYKWNEEWREKDEGRRWVFLLEARVSCSGEKFERLGFVFGAKMKWNKREISDERGSPGKTMNNSKSKPWFKYQINSAIEIPNLGYSNVTNNCTMDWPKIMRVYYYCNILFK